LVLLDVLMPGMSGTEVIDKMRGFSRIPIILLSAKTGISEIAKQCGADDHISKPVNPKYLLEKIEGFLGKDGNTPQA
jgi:CheY-like chemotaxis protein